MLKLVRIRIGNLVLENIPVGGFKILTRKQAFHAFDPQSMSGK